MQLDRAISEFLRGYFSTHERSQKTKIAYSSDLQQFARHLPPKTVLSAVHAALIEEWAEELKSKKYAPASMRRKMVVLKVFFSYWTRKGAIKESPFWRVSLSLGRTVQLPRTVTESEIRGLFDQANNALDVPRKGLALATGKTFIASSNVYRSLRNLAIIDLLFATGMRVGELSALNVEDFEVAESLFRVTGKGGRHRLAFVVDTSTVTIQRQHLQARQRLTSTSSALFVNSVGQRLSTQGVANIIATFRKDAGIERHITPHMFRHTVATLLLRNGVDIRVVQEFLGHASIATTKRYTHVTKEHLIKVLRKHHPSLGIRTAS